MALGMVLGTRLLGDFSRRRLFGLTIAAAAVPLALIGLVPVLGAVVLFVVLLGALSGIAYATGFTIVGLEVDDDTRGRVFAFFQSSIQVILFAVIAVVPILSYGATRLIASLNGTGNVKIGNVTYASAGQNVVILVAAVAGLPARHPGLPADGRPQGRVAARGPARRGAQRAAAGPGARHGAPQRPHAAARPPPGLLIAFEGGEGSGKTTQARLTSIWLRELGYDVETTREPGATKVGMRLRALLLDTAHTGMSAAGRGADVRGRPRRARRRGHRARPGARARSSSPTGTWTPRSPTRARAGTCRSTRSPGSTRGPPAAACRT